MSHRHCVLVLGWSLSLLHLLPCARADEPATRPAAAGGVVQGKVTSPGEVPLSAMVVYLESPDPKRDFAVPKEHISVSQKGAKFAPPIVVVCAGQTVDVGYTDDLVTGHALEFIRNNKDHPFFCYVPFHIVHGPLQAKEEDLPGVDPKVTDKTKRTYAAIVQALDKNVATILTELEKLGLSENTIVVFTSDNGATQDGTKLPFRGGKHTLFEGGTHLPTVIYWPKGGLTGGRTWDGLCGSLDIFPTLIAMADLKMPQTRPLDGKNIWPALRDSSASPVESYYWSWHNEDAIRTADWRMHRFLDRVELYDMHADIAEANDVAAKNPDVVASLKTTMNSWVDSMGVALTHLPAPAKLDAKPMPEGEVLEISVTVTEKVKPKDSLVVPFARWEGNVCATDYIEYDLAVAPGSPLKGFLLLAFQRQREQGHQARLQARRRGRPVRPRAGFGTGAQRGCRGVGTPDDVCKRISVGTVTLEKGKQDIAFDVVRTGENRLFVMQMLKGVYLTRK